MSVEGEKNSLEDQRVLVEADQNSHVYLAGTTYPIPQNPGSAIPTQSFGGMYFQDQNASVAVNEPILGSDAFLASFSPSNQLLWSTHFGGRAGLSIGDEVAQGLAVFEDKRIYLVGSTNSRFTPYAYPGLPAYDDPTLNGDEDGFISRFCISQLSTSAAPVLFDDLTTKLHLYPNPVSDRLSLSMNLPRAQVLEVGIYNALGQWLHQEQVRAPSGPWLHSLSTRELPSGLYTLSLQGEGWSTAEKFVK